MVTQNQRKVDIHFMGPLCTLGNILAIIPPRRLLTKRSGGRLERVYKMYAVFMFLIVIIGNGLAIFGRFKDAYSIFPKTTLIVTDLAVAISTGATNIFAILVPSLFQLEVFKVFFQEFIKIDDRSVNNPFVPIKKCKAFYIELVVGHLILLAIFISDAYVWITEIGFTIFRHYIFRNFQFYQLFITSMAMYNFSLSMKYRFQVINDTLRKLNIIPTLSSSNNNNATTIETTMESWKSYLVVRDISRMYESQIRQVVLFNTIFGWQILFMTLSTMMCFLNCWDILTVYLFTEQNKSGETYGYGLLILGSLWALWQLIMEATVVISCGNTEKTAQETADVCFNQLLKLPVIFETPQEKALQGEFHLLSQLAIHRCPSFSAAGFFSVNCSLLLAIIGSVTSYVIVLIQFK